MGAIYIQTVRLCHLDSLYFTAIIGLRVSKIGKACKINGSDKKFTEMLILKIKSKKPLRAPKGVNGRIKRVVKS